MTRYNYSGTIIDIFKNGSIRVSGGQRDNVGDVHYNFSGVVVTQYSNGSAYIEGSNGGFYDDFWDGNTTWHGVTYSPVEWEIYNEHIGLPTLARGLRALAVVATLLTLIGTFVVSARLYIRKFLLKRFFLDDWLILSTLLVGLGSSSSFLVGAIINIRLDFWPEKHPPFSWEDHMSNITIVIYGRVIDFHYLFVNLQSTLGRLSILYTFFRLSISDEVRNVRRIIGVAAAAMTIMSVPLTWMTTDPCWPPGSLFTDNIPNIQCIPYLIGPSKAAYLYVFFVITSSLNAIFDLFSFSLPFLVFKLVYLSPRRRHELYALFGFGFIVFLISVARVIQAVMLLNSASVENYDLGFSRSQVFAIGEANAVMAGACFPVLAKPVRQWCKKWRKVRRGSTSTTAYDEGFSMVIVPDVEMQKREKVDR